jgi:hypothetical protein
MPNHVHLILTPHDEAGLGRAIARIREAEGIGRPLGNAEFVAGPEQLPGRPIARRIWRNGSSVTG